jgi:hypothetical protein
MVMKKTEAGHAGGFILSEANFHRSRENVTVLSGQVLLAGAVVGKITSGGKYAVFNNDLSDGTEAAAGVLVSDCDATDGDVEAAIIARDAEVNANELIWAATEDATDIAAGIVELTALGIIVRA